MCVFSDFARTMRQSNCCTTTATKNLACGSQSLDWHLIPICHFLLLVFFFFFVLCAAMSQRKSKKSVNKKEIYPIFFKWFRFPSPSPRQHCRRYRLMMLKLLRIYYDYYIKYTAGSWRSLTGVAWHFPCEGTMARCAHPKAKNRTHTHTLTHAQGIIVVCGNLSVTKMKSN